MTQTDERRPSFKHRLEYAAFGGFVRMAQALDSSRAVSLGSALGSFTYSAIRFRRVLVEDQLRHAFPEKDAAWIRRIARESYRHLGREAIATMRLMHASRAEVLARTEAAGVDEFHRALNEGNGAIIMAGHVGNHEMAAAALAARDVPVDVVVQQQGNPLFNQGLNETRRRMGLGIMDRFESPRLAMKALRAGRAVAFAADQDAGRSGVFVPFFGRLASTHRGPALFAFKTGAPVFFGYCLRTPTGYTGGIERLEVDRNGPLDAVVYNLTAAFTARLEEVVRSAPDQYLWLHRRWKTRPPMHAAERTR